MPEWAGPADMTTTGIVGAAARKVISSALEEFAARAVFSARSAGRLDARVTPQQGARVQAAGVP
jgi:hypothetical protein